MPPDALDAEIKLLPLPTIATDIAKARGTSIVILEVHREGNRVQVCDAGQLQESQGREAVCLALSVACSTVAARFNDMYLAELEKKQAGRN